MYNSTRTNFSDANLSRSTNGKYIRESLPYTKKYKRRPKPLQPENEEYYDSMLSKNSKTKISHIYYQPQDLDHAEL